MVVFGQKRLYSVKVVLFRQKWLYSVSFCKGAKEVVFWKVVVVGQI